MDLSCRLLGYPSSFPVYITATALGRLAHPDGEVALTRAAYTHGVVQMCPTLASCTLEDMTQAAQPGQTQFFQLYGMLRDFLNITSNLFTPSSHA